MQSLFLSRFDLRYEHLWFCEQRGWFPCQARWLEGEAVWMEKEKELQPYLEREMERRKQEFHLMDARRQDQEQVDKIMSRKRKITKKL